MNRVYLVVEIIVMILIFMFGLWVGEILDEFIPFLP